jgi:hypothetical protein
MSRLVIKVIPKSGRSELKKVGNSIKAWLTSAPEDGRANDELVRMLADKFDVSRSEISLVKGRTSRNKTVDIVGVSGDEIEKIL